MKIKKYLQISSVILFAVMLSSFSSVIDLSIYVSPSGSDANSGSLAAPVKTIKKAQQLLRDLRKGKNYKKITVNLMEGTYSLSEPLSFKPEDSGTNGNPVEYSAYNGGNVYISGGITLPKQWVKDAKGENIWKLKLNNLYPAITQLFADNKRLERSSSPKFYADGPIAVVKGDLEKIGITGNGRFAKLEQLKDKSLIAFTSFSYAKNDLDNLSADELVNLEIVLFNSWDNSFHKIEKINQITKEVYLKSPTLFPVGVFSNKNTYYLENTIRYLSKPQTWCYKSQTNELFYLAANNQNPNSLTFTLPVAAQLLAMKGDATANQPVNNIKFTGIQFEYTVAPRGISRKFSSAAKADVPWLDLSTGFNGLQTASESGQAITLLNSNNITFDKCMFTKLGAYAIRIDSYSNFNQINNSEFNDLGGGGIIVGFTTHHPSANGVPEESCPTNNTIKNCVIKNSGLIYRSAVGIAIMNAKKSMVSNNKIYDLPYSGISCGWTFDRTKSYTKSNTLQNNDIHDVMLQLADGAGIYTVGNQSDTYITDNTIHDIGRNPDAIGSRNNGILFDNASSRIAVNDNKIFNIKAEPIRFNETEESEMEWGTNEINGSSVTGDAGQSLIASEKLTSWFGDGRLTILINRGLQKIAWWYYLLFAAAVISIWVYLKRTKKAKKKQKRSHR